MLLIKKTTLKYHTKCLHTRIPYHAHVAAVSFVVISILSHGVQASECLTACDFFMKFRRNELQQGYLLKQNKEALKSS